MNDKDQFELIERRLSERVRASVEADLKRRYSWLGLVVLLITSGIITVAVRGALIDARVKLAAAEAIQAQASQRLSTATVAADQLTQKLKDAESRFDEKTKEAEGRLFALASRASAVTIEISNVSKGNLEISDSLRTEIVRLSGALKDLTNRYESTTAKASGVLEKVGEIDKALIGSKARIVEAKVRSDLLKYPIEINEIVVNAKALENAIRTKGYSVSIWTGGNASPDPNTYPTVYFSREIPVDTILPVLREIHQIAPGITHVEARGGTDFIFIGSRPKRSQPLNESDWERLLQDGQTQRAFLAALKKLQKP